MKYPIAIWAPRESEESEGRRAEEQSAKATQITRKETRGARENSPGVRRSERAARGFREDRAEKALSTMLPNGSPENPGCRLQAGFSPEERTGILAAMLHSRTNTGGLRSVCDLLDVDWIKGEEEAPPT